MTRAKMTPQQRIAAAIDRMEERAMYLLRMAEVYGKGDRTYNVTHDRSAVLRAARRYGRAIDAVTRCRTTKTNRKEKQA